MKLLEVWRRENLKKIPETWDGEGSQDTMWVTIAKMPNSGDMEPEETTSSSLT